MSSLFKYPGQTAPVKIGLVNARVRPVKPAKNIISPLSSLSSCLFSLDGKKQVQRKGERERELLSRRKLFMSREGEKREREEGSKREERSGEEFSSRRKPFPWRGDPRRERKTAGEREKERDKERERRKERERGELLSRARKGEERHTPLLPILLAMEFFSITSFNSHNHILYYAMRLPYRSIR